MIKGWKKLTKSEKNHVTFDAGCRCTESWLRNIRYQIQREKGSGQSCLECRMIAKKLGDWQRLLKEEKNNEKG